MTRTLEIVYLGLGTNLGERTCNLKQAIHELSLVLGTPLAVSSFMESEAWGYTSRNMFMNAVACFETDLQPLELLDAVENVEWRMGRTSKSTDGGYSDRIIDIDILFYGDIAMSTPRLTVPHPLLHRRLFVLRPMVEIAPSFVHPLLDKTVARLLDDLLSEGC